MLPIGPLMEEHRVIEKLMPAMRRIADAGRREGMIDLQVVDIAVDFVRNYADRCHHGKEEGLLFVALESKPLAAPYRRTLEELVEEHKLGRRITRELTEAAEAFRRGDRSALAVLIERLESLAEFYPRHIAKEDRDFFIPVMDYFSHAEKDDLLEAEREFDRCVIHEVYEDKLQAIR